MKVKELQKTVNIAWSPAAQRSIYLAAGTAAQQFDSNANSTLEIYAPNFGDASFDLTLKASVASQYRFQKIIWSPIGTNAAHSNGLIVGGCEGGHIEIYSAAKMMTNEADALIARQHKHTGAVSGLDFNPFQANLLASCASESEIYIWDLNNPTTHMNPGAKTQPLEDVKNVAWNRQVQHILASVFSSRCVIWDLRKSQQIIKLSDTQSRVRWHSIQWHPEAATQVWLASEDDQAPVVQLWDLRYATAPAKTYQIHQRGVLGMSWCMQDADLMVSCGKDNRIYAWNPNTEIPEGEILSEVATTATWYSDVQCCPRNPALIASSSLDGNVSMYTLFGGTQQIVQTANKIADSFPGMDQFAQAPISQQATQVVYHDLKRAPKWLKRASGVAFGFGGKLISFDAKSRAINISQVTTEPELVTRANALDNSITDANFIDYCRQRADQMSDQSGRYLWYFIKANFELNPKEELLNLLGYNKDDVDNKFAKYVKEEENGTTQQEVDQLTNRISTLTHQTIDNNALFDDISTTAAAQKDAAENQELAPKKPQFKIPSGEHTDSLITEAILTGNLEAAVELCMEAQRPTEALIIASTAGIEFLTKTQNRYLQQKRQCELSNVISALVTRDWLDFVNRCTVDSWKQALVAALKHNERKVVDICERLGDRLLHECANSVEYTRNAMLCYICAGSVDKFVSAWYQLKQLEQHNPNYKLNTAELQELAELVMVMSKSLEQQGIALELSGRFADFITEYGGLLASQGALSAALTYIYSLSPSAGSGGDGEQSAELEALRERIYNSVNHKTATSTRGGYQQQQQQPTTNAYARQQPMARGSFSQQGNQYSNAQPSPYGNNWQTQNPAVAASAPLLPPQVPTAPVAASVMPPPSIFNSTQVTPAPQQPHAPPRTETPQLHQQQPPRPPSNSSSHGGNVAGAAHARSKYVLDPSVAPVPGVFGYGNAYNSLPATAVPAPLQFAGSTPAVQPPTQFNNNAFNTSALGVQQQAQQVLPSVAPQQQQQAQPQLFQPAPAQQFNSTPFTPPANNYSPGVAPGETTSTSSRPPPPGWNDPPAVKSTRASKQQEQPSAAITHPIFGVDPNQNQNGYMDPNQYQQSTAVGYPPTAPPSIGGQPNTYYNPVANNNLSQQQQQQQKFPTQTNFQNAALANQQNQPMQQQWNTQLQQQQPTMGYTEQPAPIKRQPEAPKSKPPLPEEYIYWQTVLEELKNQCLALATDARTKRKFVDVGKRLEILYDCLRDGRLASATIQYLNQIVQCIQIADYGNALEMHQRIVFGNDFSQCGGFMPGLKVLLQSSADLNVVLR